MKKDTKYHKYIVLLSIAIMIIIPAFSIAFIQQGNTIDKAFFFTAGILYICMMIAIGLAYKKNSKKK